MTKLKELRKKKKLHLREIAEKFGISPQAVRQQENNGIYKTTTAKRYAEALGCDWRDLLD